MRRLGIAPADIEAIVLSHGHWDHVTGMEGLVRELGPHAPAGDDPPRVLGAAADPLPRASTRPSCPRRAAAALEDLGFAIVEERQPSFLLDGAVLITGEVDRTTPFETGFQRPRGPARRRVGARPADPRRPGARRPPARPRAGRAQRLRPRRDRQHRPLRPTADGRGRRRRGHRRLPPQRSDVRADHRADGRRARRPVAGARSCPRTAPAGAPSTGSRRASPTRFVMSTVGTTIAL